MQLGWDLWEFCDVCKSISKVVKSVVPHHNMFCHLTDRERERPRKRCERIGSGRKV